MNALDLLGAFTRLDMLVLGEAMLDSYLEGSARRLCQEAPVPVVDLHGRRDAPGGAANTAANAAALGARVTLLSVVGDDTEADRLGDTLAQRGVCTCHLLRRPGRKTLAKQRLLADGHLLARLDQGSVDPVDPDAEYQLVERLAMLFPRSDVVIVSDYAYGVVTPRAIRALARLNAESPIPLLVDAKDLRRYRRARPTAVKPNFAQAVALLELSELPSGRARVSQAFSWGARLLDLTGAQIAALTLDVDGALLFERASPPYRTYAEPAPHTRAAGAGDTFTCALGLALAAGAPPRVAADLAAAAAAEVVARGGTTTCSPSALRTRLASTSGHASSQAQ